MEARRATFEEMFWKLSLDLKPLEGRNNTRIEKAWLQKILIQPQGSSSLLLLTSLPIWPLRGKMLPCRMWFSQIKSGSVCGTLLFKLISNSALLRHIHVLLRGQSSLNAIHQLCFWTWFFLILFFFYRHWFLNEALRSLVCKWHHKSD